MWCESSVEVSVIYSVILTYFYRYLSYRIKTMSSNTVLRVVVILWQLKTLLSSSLFRFVVFLPILNETGQRSRQLSNHPYEDYSWSSCWGSARGPNPYPLLFIIFDRKYKPLIDLAQKMVPLSHTYSRKTASIFGWSGSMYFKSTWIPTLI